jgi:hypothetical protein
MPDELPPDQNEDVPPIPHRLGPTVTPLTEEQLMLLRRLIGDPVTKARKALDPESPETHGD